MNTSHFAGAVTLLIVTMCVWGCGSSNRNANNVSATNTSAVPGENANTAKTNIEELSLLVNIPYQVDDDVVWKEDAAHKKVIAVLHFSRADSDKIVSGAVARQAPQEVTIPSESWYPAELVAQSEMSGGDGLKGIAYAADEFFMEPYTSGRIVRVRETDYFVLQLSGR
jgi:hypothetical protein